MIHGSNTAKEERDLLRTPVQLFDYAESRFGPFDVDLAADEQSSWCSRWYGGHGMFWIDSLESNWSERFPDGHGWLNPPYRDIGPWVKKAVQEARRGFSTTMLLPAPNGESHTSPLLEHATEIIWIVGRIAFVGLDGKPRKGNPRGSVLAYFQAHRLGGAVVEQVRRDDIFREFSEWSIAA